MAEEESCQDLVGGLGPWHSGRQTMSERASGQKGSDAWSLEQSGLQDWGAWSGPHRGVGTLWAGRSVRKLREVGRVPSGRGVFVWSLSGECLWVRGRSCA